MLLFKSIENGTFPFKVEFSEVEHAFHYESSVTDRVYGSLTICAIFLVNYPLLRYIFKHGNTTFINKLVAIDCCLCIGNTIPVFTQYILGKSRGPFICLISPPYGYLINVLNSLLSMSIVTYRYVFVLKSSWVQTKVQRQQFCFTLAGTIAALSSGLTILVYMYREHNFYFLGLNINHFSNGYLLVRAACVRCHRTKCQL